MLLRGASVLQMAVLLMPFTAAAQQFDIHGPAGSVAFGTSVTSLPNGNFVVTDPSYRTSGASYVGAVYLFDPSGNLISTLTGSAANDCVGGCLPTTGAALPSIIVLPDGNFLILSPDWANRTGAVTWGSKSTGVSGMVSATNSFVGASAGDQVGRAVTVLANGNYVVASLFNGIGAATWLNGSGATHATISNSNSLVDTNGGVPIALANGNYVVANSNWANGTVANAGAVTWGDGTHGTVGTVSTANSLVGDAANDFVGYTHIVPLNNGNYVVASSDWNNASAARAGAVTLCNGAAPTIGVVGASNSLVGATANDDIGWILVPLSNGNYVTASSMWNGGAGSVTWGSGTTGVTGAVSAANSLVGSGSDEVGYHVGALSNGNYVVGSPGWEGGLGAVTWANGTTGLTGSITSANSLVGGSPNDHLGSAVTPLLDGNYLVARMTAQYFAGQMWLDGTHTITGTWESLPFFATSGYEVVTALDNGGYVISDRFWNEGAAVNVGAATWASPTGISGQASASNSLVGAAAGDAVGGFQGAVALTDGNYAVPSPSWNNTMGAVTWGNATIGTVGVVGTANSLTGSIAGSYGDQVGMYVVAVANGNYVVVSPNWNYKAGATTLVHGKGPYSGAVNARNSVVGQLLSNGAPNYPNGAPTFGYDAARDHLIVGRPYDNIVTVFNGDIIFADGFE
jgi:hypothetical protein